MISLFQCLAALKLATFNIRYAPLNSNLTAPEAPWSVRLPLIISQINWESPDILGAQEALDHQYLDLVQRLGSQGYAGIGVGRNDGKREGEYAPIFWKEQKFELINHQYFWLSPTPEIPGSIGWDAGQPRMVTVVELRLKDIQKSRTLQILRRASSESSFYVMNTHFDNQGVLARQNSAILIRQRAEKLVNDTGKTLFLTGDLNSTPEDAAYKLLTAKLPNRLVFTDSRMSAASTFGAINATFTGFENNPDDRYVLDHLMTMDQRWQSSKYGVIPNRFDEGDYASDHRLVCAQFTQKTSALCIPSALSFQ
ncbi:hypothetical protein CROQUDRAFT_68755 [Cronartium quercuum f. sp. fusiforme G11]|uniref:Endonuclease/exonuclease/phosphatase domain-containing protein n=1 Tax=Cronartium quercuum f. sp. fusiforme G11 TaxID=708437 RepID=A0A9P6N817_9BASI|nr:hypothetical protein CROQUDRAFT_68755 [Cronartium quercuum f. sp. fusiforme G11]